MYLQRNVQTIIIALLLSLIPTAEPYISNSCPIGFMLKETKDGDQFCYRRKEPESFADKYVDCIGNLFTYELYQRLDLKDVNSIVWTDFKNVYSGGPFVDWSYTKSAGSILKSTFDIPYDKVLSEEDLCIVYSARNFSVVKCDEKFSRLCVVKPYPDVSVMEHMRQECGDGYWKFSSPQSTCLKRLKRKRATWSQALDFCTRENALLLHRGWRYANNMCLQGTQPFSTTPLGIVKIMDSYTDYRLNYYPESEQSQIPLGTWNFNKFSDFDSNYTLVGLRDGYWQLVNSSTIFFDIICEKADQPENITLEVAVDIEGRLILKTNEIIKKNNEKNIICYTDSDRFYIKQVEIEHDKANIFVLKPLFDGYYWCSYVHPQNSHAIESNKTLFIRTKQSVLNLYAMEIRHRDEYNLQSIPYLENVWAKVMMSYIYSYNKYIKVYGELPTRDSDFESKLHEFRFVNTTDRSLMSFKVKKLYLNRRTVMLHVNLDSNMAPVPAGWWEGMQVLSMKPAYFCKGVGAVPNVFLGESVTTHACRTFRCAKNLKGGVDFVLERSEKCSHDPPVHMTSTIYVREPPTTIAAPTSTLNYTPRRPSVSPDDNTSEDTDEEEDFIPQIPSLPPLLPTTTTECEDETVSTTVTSLDVITTTNADVFTTIPVDDVNFVDTPPDEVTFIDNNSSTETVTLRPVIVTTPWNPHTTPEIVLTTKAPPEEQLQQVLQNLETLLNDDSPVMFDDIKEPFSQMDTLLDDENLEFPGHMLNLIEQLSMRIDLNGTDHVSSVNNNIALVMADARPDKPVKGLRIAARDTDLFTDDAFEIINDTFTSSNLISDDNEAVVQLPASVSNSSRRISFVVFRNDRAFHGDSLYAVNSRVLSINIDEVTKFDNGEVIDIHLRPIIEDHRNVSRTCVYWHFNTDDTGYWSQEGCSLIRASKPGTLDTCRCDHLTHFAEVLIPKTVFPENYENALETLSVIGCLMSILGISIIGLTAILFRQWRRDFTNKIWLQLCVAIFLLMICFLVTVYVRYKVYDFGCMLIGVGLHYSTLASFCWMLVAAVLSYRRLVIVFSTEGSHRLLKASAFAWGAPCAVIGVLLAASPKAYTGRFEEMTPSGSFCYPSGIALYLSIYMPIVIMLLANWSLFALIVRSVFASRRIQRHGDSNEALRCVSVSCLLVFLFGLPWVFGLFAQNIVAAVLFTLSTTFQGFALFVFFVLCNKKTRDMWLNLLKIKQTQKIPVTSSTFTNRSTNDGWRGNTVGALEVNNSKPRSLASPDNTRFS